MDKSKKPSKWESNKELLKSFADGCSHLTLNNKDSSLTIQQLPVKQLLLMSSEDLLKSSKKLMETHIFNTSASFTSMVFLKTPESELKVSLIL